MHGIVSYIVAALLGLAAAYILTRPPELQTMRLSQFIFLPLAFLAANAVMPRSGDDQQTVMQCLVEFTLIMVFLAILVAPNIAFFCGAGLTNFLDPMDWTPDEEEIALRPIVRLIDSGRYEEAFDELEALFKTHKPTFEALHLRAKLLNHYQRFPETVAVLLQMVRLSRSPQQQKTAMELFDSLGAHRNIGSNTYKPGSRSVRISHELLLFNAEMENRPAPREILPGEYSVEEIQVGRDRWLVLAGERWGNLECYWEAVREEPAQPGPKRGFLYRVASLHQRVFYAVKGKPWRKAKADSKALQKEANEFIRQGDWTRALPLLEKASADDPDCYEIAYRLIQATHHAGTPVQTRFLLDKVLVQSRWTDNELRMLKDLRR